MSAYLIVDLEIVEPEAWERYRAAVPAVVASYGGEYLTRGGATTILEGDWKPRRVIVVRFPDKQALDSFWNGATYQPLKELRHRAARANIITVEG